MNGRVAMKILRRKRRWDDALRAWNEAFAAWVQAGDDAAPESIQRDLARAAVGYGLTCAKSYATRRHLVERAKRVILRPRLIRRAMAGVP